MWFEIKNMLLPHIALGDSAVATLEALVADPSDGAFREELVALAGQDPSDEIADLRQLAEWAIEQTPTLKAEKHAASKAATAAAAGGGLFKGFRLERMFPRCFKWLFKFENQFNACGRKASPKVDLNQI